MNVEACAVRPGEDGCVLSVGACRVEAGQDRQRGCAPPQQARMQADEIIAAMRCAHRAKLNLCDKLEAIADALPDGIDRIECLRVANLLLPLMRQIHRYEEDVVFPAYEGILDETAARTPSTERLRTEHVEDECFADEVTEVLLALGHGGPAANAEATGFMLRGLFETLRRHIAFEAEHVLPAIAAAHAGTGG